MCEKHKDESYLFKKLICYGQKLGNTKTRSGLNYEAHNLEHILLLYGENLAIQKQDVV